MTPASSAEAETATNDRWSSQADGRRGEYMNQYARVGRLQEDLDVARCRITWDELTMARRLIAEQLAAIGGLHTSARVDGAVNQAHVARPRSAPEPPTTKQPNDTETSTEFTHARTEPSSDRTATTGDAGLAVSFLIQEDALGILRDAEFPRPDVAFVRPVDAPHQRGRDAALVALRALGGTRVDQEPARRRGRGQGSEGGSRCDSRLPATYKFSREDAQTLVLTALVTGVARPGIDVRNFQTSPELARHLVHLSGARPGSRALEPSAGRGSVVSALQDAGAAVTAVEQDPVCREWLLLRALGRSSRLVTQRDFLRYDAQVQERGRLFDQVIVVPPFGLFGRDDHASHVQHAYRQLRPGGVLVAVLPATVPHWRSDPGCAQLQAWCRSRGEVWILPPGSLRSLTGSTLPVPVAIARVERI